MANGNQAMMEQAMMQGAMDMGAGPALAQGDTTPEEQAGRGGDTLLSHLTPGEIVIPKELIETEIDRRKIQSIFDKQGLDINQFTVGHESNSVNPETGYPEFGFGSWVRKQIRSVSKPIQKGWDYARYKRQRQKAEQSARAGAAQEGAAAQARIDRLMKQWEGKLSAAKIKYEAEAKESLRHRVWFRERSLRKNWDGLKKNKQELAHLLELLTLQQQQDIHQLGGKRVLGGEVGKEL